MLHAHLISSKLDHKRKISIMFFSTQRNFPQSLLKSLKSRLKEYHHDIPPGSIRWLFLVTDFAWKTKKNWNTLKYKVPRRFSNGLNDSVRVVGKCSPNCHFLILLPSNVNYIKFMWQLHDNQYNLLLYCITISVCGMVFFIRIVGFTACWPSTTFCLSSEISKR